MRRVRLFVSSPNDVGDERGITLDVIESLHYETGLRGRVEFEVVAWDRPGGGAPILATRTPQASINEGLPRPSECDIVVVIFWSRMGTPLPHPQYQKADGSPYLSGSEWEFEDALNGAGSVLLYRRLPMASLNPTDPDVDERLRQAQRVQAFFAQLRDPHTGAILRGHKEYETPEQFRIALASDLRTLAGRLVDRDSTPVAATPAPWQGSPFPGLRAFTPHDAPIYFGRGRETDELLARLSVSRFLAVVGASGSGKSSLVGAGLIPRLAAGALPGVPRWLLPDHDPGTNQWTGLRFTPGELGDNPFMALAAKLAPMVGGVTRELADALEADPSRITAHTEPETLIFIDQFEELFTTVAGRFVDPFISLLAAASGSSTCRVVVTMRSDFYHRCVDIPALAGLLEHGQFPLSTPGDTLFDMITRPAERAGLDFEEGLAGRILRDTGRDPGALPLLAYTLDELYRGAGSRTLTLAAYQRLGGVQGAIGTRAEDVFQHRLDDPTRDCFSRVFRELVEIDEQGLLARRRVPLSHIAVDAPTRRFIDVLTDARLLVRGAEPGTPPVVFVAHEALFASWIRLRDWIELIRDDLRLLRRVRAAAREWDENGRTDAYRWQHERLVPVYETVDRLAPDLDPVLAAFIEPEHQRLLPTLLDPATETYRRQAIADRLVTIGEPAIPGLLKAFRSEAAGNAATAALVRIGPAAVDGLLDIATDSDPVIRLLALGALLRIGGPAILPAFTKAMRDKDERVRSMVIGALAEMPEAAGIVAQATQDPDLDIRWRAVGALRAFGEPAIRPLLMSLHDNDLRIRAEALAALQALGSTNQDALLTALRDPNAQLRVAAAEAIAAIGPPMQGGLILALASDDPDIRWRAALALRTCGDPQSVPALLTRAVDDEHPLVRLAAVETLSAFSNPATIPALTAALSDRESDVAEAAALRLAAIGHTTVEPLRNALAEVKGSAQAGVARALAIADPRQLVPALEDPRPGVRPRVLEALVRVGSPAVQPLLEAVRSYGPDAADAAATALRAIGAAAVPVLVTLAHSSNPGTRRRAAWALGGNRSDQARSALIELLHDDEPIRMAAARGLGSIGRPALRALFRAIEQSRGVAAFSALMAIGADAVPSLLHLAAGESVVERTLAVEALLAIGTPRAIFGLSERGLLPVLD